MSDELPVNAGAPQGSVLGSYLFNVGTDTLEDGLPNLRSIPIEVEYLEPAGIGQSSTPLRGASRPDVGVSPIPATVDRRLEILPGVRNPPGWTRSPKEAHWKETGVRCLKYIDDGLLIERVNMRAVPLLNDPHGGSFRDVHPVGVQDLFDHICLLYTSPSPRD